jgi:uncharacterized protein (TIGR00645 family)
MHCDLWKSTRHHAPDDLIFGLVALYSGPGEIMERIVEYLIYRSRWLLAPIYLGLSLAIFALGANFFMKSYKLLINCLTLSETEIILVVLSLIDMAMVAGLLIMVMFSGYENFVSRINMREGEEKLSWLGKMDTSSLKAKIAASIVAISSIHLLKIFMDVKDITNDKIMWSVFMHLTFVASAFAMGTLDKKTKNTIGHGAHD